MVGSFTAMGQTQFRLTGQVLDVQTQQPIEYASVTVRAKSDSTLLYGTVTDSLGFFVIDGQAAELFFVTAQFLGYQQAYSEAMIPTKNMTIGTLALSVSQNVLTEIEVTGQSLNSVQKLEKQVFDTDQFEGARGGTAVDVLRNLPSVSVNALGEISMRGATGFLLMIDGKPSQADPTILLRQMPSNTIEDIEIITTPSAKYDPDGHAGIINLTTKKGLADGLSVTANALLGAPSIEDYDNRETARRYAADVTVNWRKKNWDIAAGVDYRNYDISGRRVGYVNTYQNQILTEFPSYGERSFDRENYSGRLSINHQLNSDQSITMGFFGGKRTQYRTADILYDVQQRLNVSTDQFRDPEYYWEAYQETGQVQQTEEAISSLRYFNENLRVRKGDFLIGSLDYDLRLDEKSKLQFSFLYERTVLGGPTDNLNLHGPNLTDTLQLQLNDNDNPLDGFRAQVDFLSSIGSTSWQSGYQFRTLKHPGSFLYLDRDLERQSWSTNPLFTNDINLTRGIHAIYSEIREQKDRLEFSAAVRLEYFDREVKITRPENTFKLQKLNLFPSFNVKYDLGEGLAARGGYSRRIDRTTTFKMTPFPEREHSETLEQGDAELLPEYIDLIELGLSKTWDQHSLNVTLYHRQIENVINRVNTIFNDSILNRIYTNAGDADAFGLDLGLDLYPFKGAHLFLGSNVYHYRIKGSLFGDQINTSNTVYSINCLMDLDLSKSLLLQVGLNYLSERITAQGRDDAFYNPYLALRKNFSKGWSVGLQWLNIDLGLLSSNEQRITTVRDNFFTTTNYIYEVDIVQLSLSYQINRHKSKARLIKSEFGDKEF